MAQECVAGALTIDSSDFIVDGGVWWTNTSGPTLHGTFQGPETATVQARIGDDVVLATQEGSTWTVTLPNGSIASSNTTVEISMTDPSGGRIALEQTMGTDDAPPSIALKSSLVRDESGDTVDFSTGQPVHSHVGQQVDLASDGCPVVHKYGYLMGASDPVFGQQTTRNALTWRFSIQDRRLDDASLAYRVLDPADTVVTDWTPLPSPTSAVYSVELNNANVPSMASKAGNYHIEVRARDWGGRESVASYCWDNEVLAAPLELGALAAASDGLMSMTLPADSAISRLLKSTNAPTVVETTVTHFTAESIRFKPELTSLRGRYSKRVLSGFVPVGVMEANTEFVGAHPPAPSITSSSGVLSNYSSQLYLVDDTGTTVAPDVFGVYTIPGRAANEGPVTYKLSVRLSQVAELRPSTSNAWGEYSTGTFTYTGDAVSSTMFGDCLTSESCSRLICTCQAQLYKSIVALDTAHIDFDPITIELSTSPAATIPLAAPSYAPSLSTAPISWDAGDDNLGGY